LSQRDVENAVACFRDDFEACIAHLRFPVTHRRAIRTTNLLERLFVEERRRLKIIPNAFGERAVLKLMFGALTRGGLDAFQTLATRVLTPKGVLRADRALRLSI
jgi:transposase-like protein